MNCYFFEILTEICFSGHEMFVRVKRTSLMLIRISDDGGDVGLLSECVVRIVVSYDMLVFSLMMVIMAMVVAMMIMVDG